MPDAFARCRQSAEPSELELNLYKYELIQAPWKKDKSREMGRWVKGTKIKYYTGVFVAMMKG